MLLHEAIDIVARQLIANATDSIEWEASPDIGQHDWDEVIDRIGELAKEPYGFDEAITLLEQRAEGIGGDDE